jgi:hypothetical protein
MISNALEALGFGFLVAGAYELSGRVAAFIVLGGILLFVGFALDGVTVRIPRLRKAKPEKPKAKLADEPLTNADVDLLEAAARYVQQ